MIEDRKTETSLRNLQRIGYLSVFVVLGAVLVWATMTTLNGAVIAPATVVAESYSKKIQHRDGGIIREINARDGDRVETGQTIITLDDTEAKSDLAIITSLLDEAYAKSARLSAQRDNLDHIVYPLEVMKRANDPAMALIIAGQDKLFQSRQKALAEKKSQFEKQIDQLTEQTGGIDSQIAAKDSQLKFIAKELVGLRTLLDKGLVPSSRVSEMDRETARLNGERGELVASKAATDARITEVRMQILQVQEESLAQTLNDLRDVESRIAELRERAVSATAKLERTVIKAPISGYVYQSTIHTIGGVITPGEQLMLILPENDQLVLQAQVRPQDIDDIHMGQSANVKFPTFNARTTPSISATVTNVSADTSKSDQNTPPMYLVRLTLSSAALQKLGDNKLKPGMTAEAFIQTRAMSPMTYLLKPLMDQFSHSLREG